MEVNKTKEWLKDIFPQGLPAFLVVEMVNFLLERIFQAVALTYIGIFWMAIYILWAIYGCFKGSQDSIKELNRKELFCYQIGLPAIMTALACWAEWVMGRDGVEARALGLIGWIKNTGNITFLYANFAAYVFIGNFVAYEVQRIKYKEPPEIGKARSSMVENVTSVLSKTEESTDQIVMLKEAMTGMQERMAFMSKEIEGMQSMLNKKRSVGYTATCIPIRYDEANDAFVLLLIKNKSHSESQWMFPGGHVEAFDNQLHDDFELQDVRITPGKIIEEKVAEEAGLTDIQLVDPYYDTASRELGADCKERLYPNTCYPVAAPVFNYLFRVSKSANCYANLGHRCHYDFTYIGEYKGVSDTTDHYDYIEVVFPNGKFFSKGTHSEAIGYIMGELSERINKKYPKKIRDRGKERQVMLTFDKLFLDSIPEMIYNAVSFYADYKKIPH